MKYLTLLSSSPCAGTEQGDSPAGELTKDELVLRAIIMFLGGKGHPSPTSRSSAGEEATRAEDYAECAARFPRTPCEDPRTPCEDSASENFACEDSACENKGMHA